MVFWVKRLRLTRLRLSSLDDLRQRRSGGAWLQTTYDRETTCGFSALERTEML
jgi:hypothetical protein